MFATLSGQHAMRFVAVLPSLRAAHAAIQLRSHDARTENGPAPAKQRQGPRASTAAAAAAAAAPAGDGNPAGEEDADPNPIFTGPRPAVILAGFYLEELPAVRHLLDAAGGHGITLVPCMPWLLEQPLGRVLDEAEPQWDEPMPPSWVQGGGWGRQRVVLLNDLAPMAVNTVVAMLEASPAGAEGLCSLVVGAGDAGKRLGEVLGAAAMAEQGEGLDVDELRYVEGEGALPPVEAAMGGTASDVHAAAAAVSDDGDDGDGLDDLIDQIAQDLA